MSVCRYPCRFSLSFKTLTYPSTRSATYEYESWTASSLLEHLYFCWYFNELWVVVSSVDPWDVGRTMFFEESKTSRARISRSVFSCFLKVSRVCRACHCDFGRARELVWALVWELLNCIRDALLSQLLETLTIMNTKTQLLVHGQPYTTDRPRRIWTAVKF